VHASAETNGARRPDVAILGGGISGIGAAIQIAEQGLGEPLILERAGQLGGTWRDNTYPGCACDIPSVLYSYSFAPNPDWTRFFAEGPEIHRYVLDIVERYGVERRSSLDTEVLQARWDPADQVWDIDTTTGSVRAPVLVVAPGPLHEPVYPSVPGVERFQGTAFHSARWRHDVDLTGKRVGVIGTGASACQFVPHIQPDVERLVLFQRTPAWVMPKPDRALTRAERAVYRRFPIVQRAVRGAVWAGLDLMIETMVARPERIRRFVHPVARWNIRRGVRDPEKRKALTPRYTLGCKRALISNDYYPAVGQPNVTLVPHAVAEIREHSVVDAAGTEHEIDVLIHATGFHVTDLPVADRIVGADGRTLAEVWNGRPRAYRGTSVAGFPNAFMLFGPNIGTANAFTMLDAQLRYLTDGLRTMQDKGLASVDVRAAAQTAWNERVHERLEGSVFTAGGCTSYYLDVGGDNAAAWPWSMWRMQRELRRFPVEDFSVERARPPAVVPA
jgi:cation diffusion facilitator CzcD-associated flavoprotein CzcO